LQISRANFTKSSCRLAQFFENPAEAIEDITDSSKLLVGGNVFKIR